MVITPRLQALMDSKKAAKASTESTTAPKTTTPTPTTYNAQTWAVISTWPVSSVKSTPTTWGISYSGSGDSRTQTFGSPTTTTTTSSTGLLGKSLIQQADAQWLTGSARRDYIEAGRAIATPVVTTTPKVTTPTTSTIQGSLSSSGTKASSTTTPPATIQGSTTSSKVATTTTPATINSGISTKTVLSPQTTLTPSSPEAKKTGKQLIAESNKLGLTGQARRDYIMKGRENKPIAEENTILKQQTNLLEDQKREEERFKNEEQARVNLDESSLLAAKAKNKETLDKYFAIRKWKKPIFSKIFIHFFLLLEIFYAFFLLL